MAPTYDPGSGPGEAGFGRLASSTTDMGGTTRTLGYGYDANGNRIRITHPDGNRFGTDHDALGRPVSLWMNETTALAGLYYYAHGGRSGRSPANGAYSQWGYDEVQRVSWVQQNAAGTAADLFLFFAYNPASQIASRMQNNDAYAWTGAYTVNRAYTTNGLNQYSAAGTASFTYDANGNLTSDGTTAFTYDVENRLVAASGARTAALRYDPLGRLYEVTGNGSTTRFLYDGDALVGEYDNAGALLDRYVHWGAGADVPFLWYEGAALASPHYLNADQQGSIILVTDGAGTPSINAYDEYGIPGVGNSGRFQYTGQIWLDEIGMYHYKARVYSPTLGRFLQTDPIGYEDQINLYAYVGNDPINLSDPSGQCHGWASALRAYGRGRTTYIVCSDLSTEVRSGGSPAWRNNNPGNLRPGDFATRHGAIGRAPQGGTGNYFAIFPNSETGQDALEALLRGGSYSNLSPEAAIRRYAPPGDGANNVARYQRRIREGLGDTGGRTVGQLSPAQLGRMVNTIAREEGWVAGQVSYRRMEGGDLTASVSYMVTGSRIRRTAECTSSEDGELRC